MIKNIPPFISPTLLKILAEMGHGDELVLADRNFPGYSLNNRVVYAGEVTIAKMLEAVLDLIPIENNGINHTILMNGDTPPVWDTYYKILKNYSADTSKITYLAKQEFYQRAKEAYAVVMTSDTVRFANLIIRKGVFI